MNSKLNNITGNEYLINILTHRDSHMERVAAYTEQLLIELKNSGVQELNNENISAIVQATRLHDIGKSLVKDDILYSTKVLNKSEIEKKNNHTLLGAKLIDCFADKKQSIVRDYAIQIAKFHHERFDGQGYPEGLKGLSIPFAARVVAVANVYDKIRSEKTHEKHSHEYAASLLLNNSGKAFDPQVISAFHTVQYKFDQFCQEQNKIA